MVSERPKVIGRVAITNTNRERESDQNYSQKCGWACPPCYVSFGECEKVCEKLGETRRQFGDRNFQPLPLKISDIPCLPLKRSHFLKIVIVMVITANDETARYGKSSLARSFPCAELNSNIPFNIIDKDKVTIKWKSTSCDLQNWMTS